MSRTSLATAVVAMVVTFCQLLLTNALADEHKQQFNRNATTSGQQVIIRTQLVEINHTIMRKLGFDFATYEGDGNVRRWKPADSILSIDGAGKTTVPAGFTGFVDALCKNRLARILADPTVIVPDGSSASLSVGSTIEIDVPQGDDIKHESKFIGTKLDVAPQLVENNRVKIDIRMSHRTLEEMVRIEQTEIPKIRARETDLSFEVNLGETFATGGLIREARSGEQTDEMELVFLVTPELVDEKSTSNLPAERVSRATLTDKAYQ